MEKNTIDYENCWDYWHCSPDAQEKCSVYKARAGRECWIYTDNLKVFDWIRDERGFQTCLECPWYKRLKNQQ